MTTQTEALKLALEALEIVYINQPSNHFAEVITVVKKALAQQSNEQAINPKTTFNEVERGLQQSRMAIATLDSITTEQRQQINEPLLQAQLFLMAVSKAVADTESQQSNEQVEPVELAGVKATIEESDGIWRECSGCYETNEGYPPKGAYFSKVFKCYLGNGCDECGGIGAIWDTTDYEEMANFMFEGTHPPAPTAQTKEPEQEPVAWMKEGWGPDCGPYIEFYRNDEMGWRERKKWTPLYTAPPQRTWVGLTDEEIDQGLLRSDYAFKTAEAWRAGLVFAMTKIKEKNCL